MRLRRYWWIPIAGLVLIAGGIAFEMFDVAEQVGKSNEQPCSPKPCAAPYGFALYISDVQPAGGRVTMQVSFTNNSDFTHTNPRDFQLRDAGGNQHPAVFTPGCPDWGDLQVARGASAGPRKICFTAPADGIRGADIIWSPDLGLFFDDVQVALDGR
jgi:hypothetical protein